MLSRCDLQVTSKKLCHLHPAKHVFLLVEAEVLSLNQKKPTKRQFVTLWKSDLQPLKRSFSTVETSLPPNTNEIVGAW